MPRILALDSGPLGQLTHPDKSRYPELNRWFAAHGHVGTIFLIPEITDNVGHLAQFGEARPWTAIEP